MTEPPLFSAIIPVYNAADSIPLCLGALLACDEPALEVIVVDDDSQDGSATVVGGYPVQLLKSPENRGPAHARNLGARSARGTFLVFVDADIVVEPDLFQRLRSFFDRHPEASAVSGHYSETCPAKGFFSLYKNLYLVQSYAWMTGNIGVINTSLAAIRKVDFFNVHGFDTQWHSAEDTILGWELARCGRQIFIDQDIRMQHLKEYDFYGLLRDDFNKSYWMARYLWAKKFRLFSFLRSTYGLRHPIAHMATVPLSYAVLFSLLLCLLRPMPFSWIFLTGSLSAFASLSLPRWAYLKEKGGTGFMFAAVAFQFLEMLVGGAAIAVAFFLLFLNPPKPVQAEKDG